MNKIKNFIVTLSKSTKVTLISCASFIFMTTLILFFFVIFPITPSERVISGLGREAIVSGTTAAVTDSKGSKVVVTTVTIDTRQVVTPAQSLAAYDPNAVVTYAKKVFTTNENYVYSGNAIPTGDRYDDETVTTTISGDDSYNNNDNSYSPSDSSSYSSPDSQPSTDSHQPVVTDQPSTDAPSNSKVEEPTDPQKSPDTTESQNNDNNNDNAAD